MCLENVSKDFTAISMKKTGLNRYVYNFSVDYNIIDTSNIIDIHEYLIKKTWYKIMFRLIKKILMELLISIVNASNHTKCVSLSSQKYIIQPILINLHPTEYSQEFHYYTFSVKLDRCVRTCNTLNDLSNKVCVPNKTEDLNLSVINMITGINESKALTKHMSCKYRCRFDGRKCISDQWWNDDKCWCECKKHHVCEKDYVWNPATCKYENGKYLASFMGDSAIMCNEIIEPYDDKTNSNEKQANCKTQKLYILLAFLLITIALLMAVSIYCYLIKYWGKQKHLLPFHLTDNKLKETIY